MATTPSTPVAAPPKPSALIQAALASGVTATHNVWLCADHGCTTHHAPAACALGMMLVAAYDGDADVADQASDEAYEVGNGGYHATFIKLIAARTGLDLSQTWTGPGLLGPYHPDSMTLGHIIESLFEVEDYTIEQIITTLQEVGL